MKNIQHYIGYWKFAPSITLEEIENLSQELAKDENYLSLHIRKASKDQYGLGFEYKNPNGTETEKDDFDQYMKRTQDSLLKKFGIGLVGWDVSRNYYKVK